MISHSPPIFNHSPPVNFLSEIMSNNHRQNLNYNDEPNGASRYYQPQMVTLVSKVMANNSSHVTESQKQQWGSDAIMKGCSRNGRNNLERMISAPNMFTQPKSCLSRKFRLKITNQAPNILNSNAETTINLQRHVRKKVIFADDEGLSLTEVRVMSEPSNVPPYWSIKFLEQITQGIVSPHPADQWTVDFKQPASDYLSFRQKVERVFVSLENVIVKDEESIVVGTVKVRNIDFEKEIVVRITWDDWKSQQDIFCTFNRAYGPATCAHAMFDTFSFKITLPPSSKRLEFCICYRTKDHEYWDNNDEKNYIISKRSPIYCNALSPYGKNATRIGHQTPLRSNLLETFRSNHDSQQNWPQDLPCPYW